MAKKRKLFGLQVIVAATLIWAAGTAGAVVVNYSEAVSGDLPQVGSPLPTFAFDIGTNTVSGTLGFTPGIDFDSFAFTVSVGAELLGAQVQLTDNVGDFVQSQWNFLSGSTNSGTGALLETIVGLSPGTDVFSTTPLGAGSFNLTNFLLQQNPPPNASANYTFTFTLRQIAAVPEPGMLALLAAGLIAAAAVRRRSRR